MEIHIDPERVAEAERAVIEAAEALQRVWQSDRVALTKAICAVVDAVEDLRVARVLPTWKGGEQ